MDLSRRLVQKRNLPKHITALTALVSSSSTVPNCQSKADSVLFEVETDFSLDGEKQTLELHVSLDGVSLHDKSSSSVFIAFEWSQIESIRTVAGIGSGLLQVRIENIWTDMLRFSNGLASRFHKVARTLKRMREVIAEKTDETSEIVFAKGKEFSLREIANELTRDSIDPPRCKACSLRLQTIDESCPRCMERGQIVRPILHLLRPHRRGAIFLCVLTILGVVAELIPPKLQQYMVDHILNGQTVGGLENGSTMLQGTRVVKAFAHEDREYERFQKTSDHLRQWRLWVENTNAWYSASMSIDFRLGGLIVWYVGGRDVIGKEMTLGELIAFLAYLAMFYAPLGALSNFTSWLTSFLSGSKRVLELMETPLGIQDPAHAKKWENPRGHLRFDHVTFGYDRNQPVIKDVSLEASLYWILRRIATWCPTSMH